MKKGLFILFILLISGCAYLTYIHDPFVDIPNFYKVNDYIYRGGYPKHKGYIYLKSLGIKTIVNFSGQNKRFFYEQKITHDYGFNFVHIPLSIYSEPEDEKVIKFFETILNPKLQPVFVHCTNGRDRTGVMIAVYRVVVEGRGVKESYKEALRYGFWPYRGEVVLKKYILQLKDRKALFNFVNNYLGKVGEDNETYDF
ncbi:MAG: tyrosine-protein phosphatase [Candidatus Omnitrophica bacterium]|nr:tyrosine-protein phosphatase [Candidatus Omnitrophota bacterium]MCM8826516.1 tyrosine-protein phosphatase [Candidatus Omnitrophota bacterium]